MNFPGAGVHELERHPGDDAEVEVAEPVAADRPFVIVLRLIPSFAGTETLNDSPSLTPGRTPNSRYVPRFGPPSACPWDSSKASTTFGESGSGLALSSTASTAASSWTVRKRSFGLVYDVNNRPGLNLPAVNVADPYTSASYQLPVGPVCGLFHVPMFTLTLGPTATPKSTYGCAMNPLSSWRMPRKT